MSTKSMNDEGSTSVQDLRPYRLGLTGKFVIQVIWIIIAVGIIFTWIPIKEERQVREQGLTNLGEALVNRWIQPTLQDAPLDIFSRNNATLERLIKGLVEEGNVSYVILIDGDRNELIASGTCPEFSEDFKPVLSVTETGSKSFVSLQGKEFVEISAPILYPGMKSGRGNDLEEMLNLVGPSPSQKEDKPRFIRAGFNKEKIERFMAESRRKKILLTLGIMIPALSLLVFIFIRNITRPLKEVTETVRSIARGNLQKAEELDVTTRDEVGALADDVKIMANKLQMGREALEKLNIELERKVEERTGDLMKANEELEKANVKLRELDQLKSEFLSTVSHELRTPLTSIKAFSEILLDKKGGDPETQQRFLNIINNQSERLTRLIGDLLNLSRIESRKRDWKKEAVDPSRIVEEAVRELSSLSQRKSIEIRTRQGTGLPAVYGSFDKFIEVVTNLLNNALKFSEKGSIIQYSVLAALNAEGKPLPSNLEACDAPFVLMEIKDHGIGIPEDSIERISERFYQVDPRKAKDMGGSGLGLSICKEIIESHGGRIWVKSRVGEGSRFFITIPSIHHKSPMEEKQDL